MLACNKLLQIKIYGAMFLWQMPVLLLIAHR